MKLKDIFKPKRYYTIAVDFDGCLSNGKWPEIGDPNWKLIKWLQKQRTLGDKIILWSCREGVNLYCAVEACRQWGLLFDAINNNTIENQQYFRNNSRKVYAGLYIDDKSRRWKFKRKRGSGR